MQYVFGDCVLDTALYLLCRAGQPVRLRRKAFQVLIYLLAQRDRVVPKQELYDHVWPGRFISDATLESTIRAVRRALEDTRQAHRMIQTLYGYGYRLVVPVEERYAPRSSAGGGGGPAETATPSRAQDNRPPAAAVMSPPVAVGGQASRAALLGSAASLTSPEPAPLTLAQPSHGGERKLVTMLCCALHPGPEAPVPADLDTLHQQLSTLYDLAHQQAQRYGGTVQPMLGECVLLVFGLPTAQEDHAQRAVVAALGLQSQLDQWHSAGEGAHAPQLAGGIGVHTGLVAVGGLHDAVPATLTVGGETVRHTVALQAAAAPGTVLCSAATARLVRGLVRLAALTPAAWPRRAAPAYQVHSRGPARLRPGRRARPPRSPFVGRQQALAIVEAGLTQAAAGRGQVVGVVGEPGLGKSRLLAEFRHRVRGRPCTYLAVSCLSLTQVTPYFPLRTLLWHTWGLSATDPPVTLRAKVDRGLAAVGLDPGALAPALLPVVEGPGATEVVPPDHPQALRDRTIAGLVQLALAAARRRPLVLAVDNLHWSDPSSDEVLTALVERLAGTALLLLVTYRPGYRLPWVDKSYVTQIPLAPLSPAEGRRVVQATLGPTVLPGALVQAILTRAGGNPFFLEEVARAVADPAGALWGPSEVPVTVQGVLAARLDRLPPAAKRLLQVAAVIGKDVPVPLLRAVAAVPEAELAQSLACLQAAEFLEEAGGEPDQEYAFRHSLVQEVTYQSLLTPARCQLHHRTAHVLAAQCPATAATHPEWVAHHYTEAGRTVEAIAYWQRAGERALHYSATLEAVRHLTRGLALLATLPSTPARAQQELELQLALGPALMATKGQAAPAVEQTYARARALCAQVGETPLLFPALRGLCRVYQSRGALQAAWELGEQLVLLAQRAAAPTPRLEAHDALGTTLFLLGDYPAARRHLEQGGALTDPAAQRALVLRHGVAPGVRCLALTSVVLWCLGYPTQAVQRSQEALTLAETLAHPQSLAYAHHNAAYLAHHRRETPTVQAHGETLLRLATAERLPLWVGHGTYWQGWTQVMRGQGEAGLAQMHQGLAAVLATGQTSSRPWQLVLLAEAAGYAGRVDEGLCLLAEALSAFEANGRGEVLGEAYRLLGVFRLRQSAPDASQADTCFQQALDIARRQEARSLELRAAMSLAPLWQQQGKRQEAYELLAPVYGWFTEGFDTADLQEAKALLEELTE